MSLFFNTSRATHVRTKRFFFGTTHSAFLGYTITPDGTRPNADEVAALTAMSLPETVTRNGEETALASGWVELLLLQLPQGLGQTRETNHRYLPELRARVNFVIEMEKSVRAPLGGR